MSHFRSFLQKSWSGCSRARLWSFQAQLDDVLGLGVIKADGLDIVLQPRFPEFAAKITPTEFAPGITFGSGTMTPVEYMVALAEGTEPPPAGLNIRTIQTLAFSNAMKFHITQYVVRRAAGWADRGYTETLTDFATLNERSKFWSDAQRAWFMNWEETPDIRRSLDERQGIHERILLRELLRR